MPQHIIVVKDNNSIHMVGYCPDDIDLDEMKANAECIVRCKLEDGSMVSLEHFGITKKEHDYLRYGEDPDLSGQAKKMNYHSHKFDKKKKVIKKGTKEITL